MSSIKRVLTSAAIAAAGATALASPTYAAPADPAAAAAAQSSAGYIAKTLSENGDHYTYPGGSYFDGGQTIDAILALDAAKAGKAQADKSFAYLEKNVGGYVGEGDELYAGPLGKTILAVQSHGGNPSAFGGRDLIAELKGLDKNGHYTDKSQSGEYSNTIGQSLDMIALDRAGVDQAAATSFLLTKQCDDGGFTNDFAESTCESNPDATAFAVQALVATQNGVTPESTKALDYLEGLADGGGIPSSTGGVNANSTAVAAQAFVAGDRTDAAAAASSFLTTLQYGCDAPEDVQGSLKLTPDAGDDGANNDTLQRATTQSTMALAGESLITVSSEGASSAAPKTCNAPSPSASPSATPTNSGGTGGDTASPSPSGSGSGGSGSGGTGTGGDNSSTPTPTGGTGSGGTGGTGDSLAYTGDEITRVATLGGLFVLAGAGLIFATRRRTDRR